MKRTRLLLWFAVCFWIAGCGARQESEGFERWREQIARAEEIDFDAELTAHWEDAESSFRVSVKRCGGVTCAEITAPEELVGISFHSDSQSERMEFDGLILDMDAGHTRPAAPCRGPERLFTAILDGWPLSFAREGDIRAVELEIADGEVVTLRLSNGTPVSAELARGGAAELTMTIDNWKIQEQRDDGT